MVEAMEIERGFKQTEIGVIPSDWEVIRIGEVFKFKNGLNKEKSFFGEGTPIVNYMDVYKNSGIRAKDLTGKVTLTNQEIKNYEVKKGDIFFTRTSETVEEIGIASVVLEELKNTVFSGFILRGSPFNSTIEIEFCRFCFSSKEARKQIISTASYTTRALTNGRLLSDIKIPLPPTRAEQTAIATALNDTDAFIAQLEKLIVKKRYIKQGAMQELLKPKEGWEVKTIGEISVVGRGRVISHKEISKAIEGKYPVYSSQTSNNGIMGYLDTYEFDGEFLTWTTDGVYAGKVYHRNGKFNCTNVCGTIKLKKDYAPLVAYLLDTLTPEHVSRNLANPKLMNDPMKRIKIPLPILDEQIYIANILSDMDTEIEALEKKLEKYKMIKQGMMQNLLTGKIRLV